MRCCCYSGDLVEPQSTGFKPTQWEIPYFAVTDPVLGSQANCTPEEPAI